jgi:hypothetical protein
MPCGTTSMSSVIWSGDWAKLSSMAKVLYNETQRENRDKWAIEIGRFIMAFGSIEATTYAALRRLPLDPIGQPLIDANLRLQQRIDLLIAIADSRGLEWFPFTEVLREVKQLAGKRNLIAHNDVGYDLYVEPSGEFHVERAVISAKLPPNRNKKKTPNERVAFHELVQHREQAEELDLRLHTALMNIFFALAESKVAQ